MNNQEQIKAISQILKLLKKESGFTVNRIINHLPDELQMTRTGFNAYLYGRIKNPPSRDMLIASLKVFEPFVKDINFFIRLCGYLPDADIKQNTTDKEIKEGLKRIFNVIYGALHLNTIEKDEKEAMKIWHENMINNAVKVFKGEN